MESKIKVCKWGNGQGIRLPKAILNMLSINEGDELDITATSECITLTPIKKKGRTLTELFKDYDGELGQEEYWTDSKPIGKEVF